MDKVQAAKELFFKDIGLAGEEEHLSIAEGDVLYTILTHRIFKRACNLAFREVNGIGARMMGLNLSTSEGLQEAQRSQGRASGFIRAYEALFELIESIDERERQDAEEISQ